jgi:hypothetical protein
MAEDLSIRGVMTLGGLGLDGNAGADRAVLAFAEYAEARIARWVQFPRGVLLFLMVPGDPESGWFYLLDRPKRTFYSVDIQEEGRWGGYREDEFDRLAGRHALRHLAERPENWLASPAQV